MIKYTNDNQFSLAYHQLGNNLSLGLNRISCSLFESHLKALKKIKCRDNIKIEIIFDDGYESTFTIAMPLMEKYGFKGTVFPVAAYLGKSNNWDFNFFGINSMNHLDEKQIYQLSQLGWKIGSDGLSHKPLHILNSFELDKELRISKEILEKIINKEVKRFTPPFSMINEQLIKKVFSFGYKHIYLQKKYIPRYLSQNIVYRNSVYSIDNSTSLNRKSKNSIFELFKENIIHHCSKLTVIAKQLL